MLPDLKSAKQAPKLIAASSIHAQTTISHSSIELLGPFVAADPCVQRASEIALTR